MAKHNGRHPICVRFLIDKMTVLAESLHLTWEVVLVSNGCSNSQVKSFSLQEQSLHLTTITCFLADVTNTDVAGFSFVPNSITKHTCRLVWQQNVADGFSLCAMSSKPTGAKSTIISYVTYIQT